MRYSRTLDYTVLALDQLQKKNYELAARLFAKAGEQTDIAAAIRVLEHSNKTAYAAEIAASSKSGSPARRLKADSEEFPFTEGEEPAAEEPADESAPVEEDADAFDGDPLDEVEDAPAEVLPAKAMASVLSRMARKQ